MKGENAHQVKKELDHELQGAVLNESLDCKDFVALHGNVR